ncbi:MAG TPA: FHA domain-containing protein [Kofleriaceae bacterium]|nr:FHA domain-containing protein [Kofleriaceae bacterium]
MKGTARLGLAGLLLVAGSLAGAPAARAAGPRLLLDRAELEPSWFPGLARLRLHVTAIQLEGTLIPVGGDDPFVLMVSGSRRREPYLVGRYAGSGGATAVVVVVQTGWEMRDDLEAMREAVAQLWGGLPSDAQIALVTYGEGVDGGNRLGAAHSAADRRVDAMEADAAPADQQLIGAVERAVTTLGRARAPGGEQVPLRRIVVVLSDGKDADPDPSRYRLVGERAEHLGIRVHSIAFSPVDNRGPLLGLGELSKRSGGTFRWVRSREGFRPQMDTLLAEIDQQYVLTFFLPAAQLAGKRLAVGYRDLESNEVKVKEVSCGGKACGEGEFCARHACVARGKGGGGLWWWVLWIGGGLIGLLVVVGAVGALAGRRAGAPAGQVPGQVPGMTPGQVPGMTPGMAPGQVPGPVPGAAPVASGSLLVMAGPYQGQRMPLRHGFVVGSARGCDFTVPGDPQVIPHHAIFVMDARGAMAVVDRGSPTGTFVNGVRITEARLQHGNLIRIGSCSLRYLAQ